MSRVSKTDAPASVTEGETALSVEIGSGGRPRIRKELRKVGLSEKPYLIADVVSATTPNRASFSGIDEEILRSEVVFEIRLRDEQGTVIPTETFGFFGSLVDDFFPRERRGTRTEATQMERPLLSDTHIYWDMSSLDDGFLSTADVLEIEWYLEGGADSDNSLEGMRTYFDNIRMTSSESSISRVAIGVQQSRLRAEHGTYRYEALSRNGTVERGKFVYSDGYEVEVRFEMVSEDRYVYTIGNESYRIGDW